MKLHSLLVSIVLLAGLSGTCLAAAADAPTTVPEILQTQHAIRAKLDAPTGDYARLDRTAVQTIETAQDKIFNMLSGVTSLDQLSMGQKVELSNALDQVKATLAANENARVICHVEARIGTHLTERRCETVAGREERARKANEAMTDNDRHVQLRRGN